MNKYQIMEDAIEIYGERTQIVVAIEELSELQKELCKYLRGEGKTENISEEMADVEIIMDELYLIFGNDEKINEVMKQKLARLDERVKCSKKGKNL